MAEVGAGALVDGKYRILRLIGEGGWGVVYEAENVRTLKHVALKLLRPRPELTADIRTRFEREAQAAGRIGSDHIVEVFDLGTLDDGTHYMVMELLQGQDLASRLQQGPVDSLVAVKLVVQLLEGLAAAHEAGIFHRDLKPENVFLVPTRSGDEFVKILDFGISKFNAPDLTSATITGAVLGSPVYMAPEQARGLKHVDPRTDLYSVGAVLYEMLTGRVPFTGENFNDLMFKIALAPRPSPLSIRPELDPPLAHLVIKAIAADPKERFQSASEFRTVLTEWLASQGVTSSSAPDFRRALVSTPREVGGRGEGNATPPDAPGRGSPPNAPAPWGAATVAGDANTAATPLAGSSMVERKSAKASGRGGAWVGGAALLLFGGVAAVGLLAMGQRPRPQAAVVVAAPPENDLPPLDPQATAAPPALPPLQPTQPPQPLPPPAQLSDTAVVSPPVVVEGTSQPAGPSPLRGRGAAANETPWRPTRPQHASSPAPVASSASAPSAPASVAPPAPTPVVVAPSAAPSTTTPKGVDKVEGREFRTGL
jgi:eukaryotic-like serine/threonine-protein kinase